MFNTTINRTEYGGPSRIDVNEKRAPTDESVRLLREMEEKILNNILDTGKIENNIFNCRWTIVFDGMEFADIVHCKFLINGKEHKFKFYLPVRYGKMSNEEFINCLRDKVAEQVTYIFLDSLWRAEERQLIDIAKGR